MIIDVALDLVARATSSFLAARGRSVAALMTNDVGKNGMLVPFF